MNAIHAVYENGVFRPLEAVDLPEATEVWLNPRPVPSDELETVSPREALRRLQAEARLTPAEANAYLDTIHAERLAAGGRAGAP